MRFSKLNEIFLIDAIHLFEFWRRYEEGGRKSISRAEIIELGHIIPLFFQPQIPYLPIEDTLYF
ncbi:Holliday junction resolvase RecU [Neobacillus drentensis]|uniref:Holliday junction resolvase RecU n=1 Tax=Neobacillus drentensis TaxID=220684 RepID=UPI003B588481